MILSTSSRLSSTFRPIARVDVTSSNSDTSSTDSDYAFPPAASHAANVPNPTHSSLQAVVRDVTAADGSGQSSFVLNTVILVISLFNLLNCIRKRELEESSQA